MIRRRLQQSGFDVIVRIDLMHHNLPHALRLLSAVLYTTIIAY